MNKLKTGLAFFVALLLSPFVCAQGWQPSPQESDAFIEAYSFPTLKAVANVVVSIKLESGEINTEMADCVRKNISFSDLLVAARPIIAKTFRNRDNLIKATSFYMSPTGNKIKDFGTLTLGNYLRAKAKNLPPPPRPEFPDNFTQLDQLAAAQFETSPAGKDFGKFVAEGLPQLRSGNSLAEAINLCKKNGLN
ncbi:MAG: hypothetical protein WAV95_18085 [Azonexus sp.]